MTISSRRSAGLAILAVAMSAGRLAAQGRQLPDDPRARMEYFYRQRAYPLQSIPPGALQAARTAFAATWPAAFGAQRVQLAPSAAGWSPFGPRPLMQFGARYAGRVTAIALDPSNRARLFIGAAQGGVWRSDDGGTNWIPLTDGECSLATGSIGVDPIAPSIVYVGTGEANLSGDSYYGCGVLRSTDGGTTWTRLGAQVFGAASISKILVDRVTAGSTTGTTIFASTNLNFATSCAGLFKSTNSGATWTGVLSGCVSEVLQDPVNASTLYATVMFDAVYKSPDKGVTWQRLSNGFPTVSVGRIQLAISASQPSTLYAAVASTNGGGVLGVFKSTDAGATWSPVTATGIGCNAQCWYDLVIVVDPTNPDLVYFGGVPLFRSTDGGATFTSITTGIHVDQHALVIEAQNPSVLWLGNDGGVYRSADYGSTWTDLNSSLSLTQFYPGVSAFPGSAYGLLGGTQDNGTLEYEGSPAWQEVLGADGGFTTVNFQTPTTAFAECQWRACGPVRRDAGSGGTFVQKSTGINFSDDALFIPPLVMDPVNPQVLYFGTTTLYRTSDNAESWAGISPSFSGRISAIAAAPSNTSTIYVGTEIGTVQVTANGGSSWLDITAGLPNRYVTDVTVDPADFHHAYVIVSGFGSGHVFETVNSGTSWQNISSNLPDVPVNAIFRHPGTGALYIGADLGVLVSTNDGQAWGPSASGLPNVAVTDLAFNGTTQTLYAGTHGRGVFAFHLGPALLRGDVSGDGNVTAADAQGILTGVVGLQLPVGWAFYPNGDANCDGQTSAVDAQIVLSFVVGLPTAAFCVGTVQ